MPNNALFIGFVGLLVIIPALVVAVVLFLRIESFSRRFDTLDMRFHGIEALEKIMMELRQDVETTKAKYLSLEESFASLSNKWSARMSVEARRAKREERKEDVDPDDQIPGTQQEELLLPPQPEQTQKQPPKRKFGTFPFRKVA